MKLRISRSAAWPAAFCAVSSGVFLTLSLGDGATHNGAWIAALLSALPTLPWLTGLDALRSSLNGRAGIPLKVALLIGCAWNGAVVLSFVTRSADYLTLNHVPAAVIALPLVLALLWCLWRNGDALGWFALLWTRVFPAFMLLVLLLQLRHYRPAWLCPLFGDGWRTLLKSGAMATGAYVPAGALLLVSDAPKHGKVARASAVSIRGAVVAAALLALWLMMTPTVRSGDTWLYRLDTLLTNGRAPLYLQLPMIVLWFISLAQLLSCACFAAAALLQRLVSKLDGRICAVIVVLVCALAAWYGMAEIHPGALAWLFVVAAALTAFGAGRMRGEQTCGV